MELKIYNQSGVLKLTVSTSSSSTWNNELMTENAVSASWVHPQYVPLDVNDYVLLEGVKFSIKKEYKPKQKNTQTYNYSVKFYAPIHDAEQVMYLNLTDGQYEPQFSLDGSPREHLQKWIDNMNRIYGEEVWSIGDVIEAPNQTIEYSSTKCWDSLGSIAEAFGTEWWSDGFYINLCRCERGERVELGYMQGLTSLTQTENNDDVKFFTRLLPLGSTKNIDRTRYGFSRLQLPDRAKYVDRNTNYGLYEHVESEAFAGIYPHYTGTLTSVRTEEKTGEDKKPFTVYFFKDSGMAFDPSAKENEIAGLVKHVSFQTGDLAGRNFEANYNSTTKEWEIINIYPVDDVQIPGGNLIPAIGNKYIPWNFKMPVEYEVQAEKDYKVAVDDYLSKYSEDIAKYGGDTDYIYINKNGVALSLGQRVRLLSDKYFPDTSHRDSRMTKVVRKLDNLSIATIECTNKVGKGWKKTVDDSLSNLQYVVGETLNQAVIDVLKSWDGREPSEHNVFSAKRTLKELEKFNDRYLRRDQEDSTDYLTGFNTGITIGKEKKELLDILRLVDHERVATDTNVYSALMIDERFTAIDDRYLRKDQPDSTLYPVDFMGGLSINSKRIGDVIRYYDEVRAVSTDANIYSALMTDQRIEEEFEGLDDRYLRKDKEDFAHKHITFEEGITVYELAEMMNLDVKNLATIAKAVVSILRSSKFVDGFSGEGYQIWQDIASGDWNLTIDRLTVRKVMTIYELIIQKIRSVGGMVVVSAANGKVKTIEKIGNQYLFTFEDANQFQPNDLMRCQVFTGKDVKYYWVKVASVSGESVIVPVSEFAGVVPAVGDECVLMGNTTNKRRQSLIIISATEDGQPRFDCLNGVKTKSFEGCLKVRVGNLDGISDSRFPENMQPSGHGIYGNNCFLTGVFVLSNGKDVMTMFAIMEGMIKSEISSVRNEINAKDNYLSNAAFADNLVGWQGSSNIRIFSVNGKLLMFNNNFYANKETLANIVSHDSKNVLRLKNSSITQYNSNFSIQPEFDDYTQEDPEGNPILDSSGNPVTLKRARMFYVSFKYMVTRPGTLRVYFKGENSLGFEEYESIDYTESLQPGEDFKTIEIAGKWNGTGDFFLSFSGDMYLHSLALADNRLADAIEKFNMKFELTDKKLQLNFDEIKKTGTKLEEYHSEFLLTARQLELKFTQDLSDSETRITEAYRSHVRLTARDLTVAFEADIDDAENRITTSYTGAINMSAQGLETKFTKDITDMEVGVTAAYKGYFKVEADGMTAAFEKKLVDLKDGITEEYEGYFRVQADGLTSAFNRQIEGINGVLTRHSSQFEVTADEIRGLVSTTSNLGGRLTTAESSIIQNANSITSKVSNTDFSREIDNAKILAAVASGSSLYDDPTFKKGNNGISPYNNAGGSTVTIVRKLISGVPNDTGYGLEITTSASGNVTPGWGGFFFGTPTKANRLLVCRFTAKIPVGYTIVFTTNAVGTGNRMKWLTDNVGTDKWQEYAYYVQCGNSGTFSSTFFFYLTGKTRPVTWEVAQANVYEISAQDLASKYSQIKQTVDSIGFEVNDTNGKFARLKVTVDAISSIIGDGAEGDFSQIIQRLDSIESTVQKLNFDKDGNITNISKAGITTDSNGNYLFATRDEFNQQGSQIGSMQSSINQTADAVETIVGRFNPDGTLIEGTKWITTAYGNQWLVKKDGIISSINQTSESVSISASKINLNGAVTANSRFKIKLDGSIETADALMNNVTANNMTLKGNITGIDATLTNVTVADGAKIGRFHVLDNYLSLNDPQEGTIISIGSSVLPATLAVKSNIYIKDTAASFEKSLIVINSTQPNGPYLDDPRNYNKAINIISGTFRVSPGNLIDTPGFLVAGRVGEDCQVQYQYGRKGRGSLSPAYAFAVSRSSDYLYTVIHNLGHTNYTVSVTPWRSWYDWNKVHAIILDIQANDFKIIFVDSETNNTWKLSGFCFEIYGENTN